MKVIQKKVADELLKDAEETSDTVVAIIAPEEIQMIIEKWVQLILMSDYIEFENIQVIDCDWNWIMQV